ncbi:MAG: hypothetical protein WEA61_05345, partial [Anaerolineales bacterium]
RRRRIRGSHRSREKARHQNPDVEILATRNRPEENIAVITNSLIHLHSPALQHGVQDGLSLPAGFP